MYVYILQQGKKGETCAMKQAGGITKIPTQVLFLETKTKAPTSLGGRREKYRAYLLLCPY